MHYLLGIAFVLSCVSLHSQLYETVIGTFPSQIEESSGIDSDSKGRLWTFNDGGNQAKLYQINLNGSIQRTITINNATNVDWEDISISPDDKLFLADIGNNDNDRTNLCIYIIDLNLLTENATQISAEKIFFTYPDQFTFPPPNNQKNFDAEAISWYNDSIYIFTKNRTSPNNGFTRCYKLPSIAGNYVATYCAQFYTSNAEIDGRITASDIHVEKKILVLLSSTKIWKFTFDILPYEFQNPYINNFSSFSQKEAVCFEDDCHFWVTDEKNSSLNLGGNLYHINTCPNSIAETYEMNNNAFIYTYSDLGDLTIGIPPLFYGQYLAFSFYDLTGNLINKLVHKVENLTFQIPVHQSYGHSILLITKNNEFVSRKVILQKPQ